MLIIQSIKQTDNKMFKILVFRFCNTLQKQKKIHCGTKVQAGQLRNCGVICGTVKSVLQRVQTSFGAQKTFVQWVLGSFFLGCEADHSPASSDKVKNEWRCPSTPHMPLWQAQGQLYLYLQFTTCVLHQLHTVHVKNMNVLMQYVSKHSFTSHNKCGPQFTSLVAGCALHIKGSFPDR